MKVFISHSPQDKLLARKIASGLEKHGLDVWDESREIVPGENWAEKISQALKESEAMIVLLTPDALQSDPVRWEIDYALSKKEFNRRLIPVLVGNADSLPEENIPWILRHLNLINLLEYRQDEEKIERIADALKEVA